MTTEWKQFNRTTKIVELKDNLSKIIVKEIGNVLDNFFSYKESVRPNRTRLIKDTLALLGEKKLKDKPKYAVYANGLSPHLRQLNGGTFKNAEWLFDLHWYTDGKKPYTTLTLPLVVECEWQQKRKGDKVNKFSGIKYDFQKLLVTNAELRLMIFKVVRPTDFDELAEYFEDNISNYSHLDKGAKFLFVAFSERQKTFYYSFIQK